MTIHNSQFGDKYLEGFETMMANKKYYGISVYNN